MDMSFLALNAQGDVLAMLATGGGVLVLDGKSPGSNNAITTQKTLVVLRFGLFEPTEAGLLRASMISAEALVSGNAAWFRVLTSKGAGLGDGTVGEKGSGADMIVRTTSFVNGVMVHVATFLHDLNPPRPSA